MGSSHKANISMVREASVSLMHASPVHNRTGKRRRRFAETLLAAFTNHIYPLRKRVVCGERLCFNPARSGKWLPGL
jgi:hypothetical protein